MDKFNKDKWEHYRRIEKVISDIEKDQAKINDEFQTKSTTKSHYIGPANTLLRFLYVLEKQNQNDSDETRAEARENLMDFIQSHQPSTETEQEEEPEETNDDDPTANIPQQTPVIVPQQSILTPPVQQPVATTVSQPSVVTPVQQPILNTIHQPVPTSSTSAIRLSPVTDPDCITPTKLQSYESLLVKANQYAERYKLVDDARKKQLAARLREIVNKLRTDTFATLTDELFRYLNGEEQKVSNQMIRINNHDERLLCLSMLANLILRQLLGGDLTDIKTEVFLPLIIKCSANQQQQEFSTIFLDHLHKKCPYTVPFYPKQEPNMNEEQYLQTLGYNKKQEGGQIRLETDSEFINRMSGFIRLFCKLLVSRGPPFDNSLSYAWQWFSDVLNLPPRSNITSILIRVFLDEAGDSMLKEYGKQFNKVINAVHQYLPKLQQESSADQITRLQLTLEKFRK